MKCPNCKRKNSKGCGFCEFCGQPLEEKAKKKMSKKWVAIIVVFAVLLCSIGVLYATGIGPRFISNIVAGTFLESEKSKAFEEHYQNGISYMEDEDYINAVSEFSLIPKGHHRYPEAQDYMISCSESFAEKIDSEIDACETEEEFLELYEVLTSVDKSIFDDVFSVDEKIEDLQTEYENYLISLIEDAEANGDFAGALDVINNRDTTILPESEILLEKEELLKESYLDKVKTDAAALLESDGYEAAVACLRAATVYLPDNGELDSLIEEYSAYQPVRLYDLSYFSSGALYSDWTERETDTDFDRIGKITDNLGEEYFDGIKHGYSFDGTWESYQIDREYREFTGKIIIDNSLKSVEDEGYVKIIGDGIELYSSPKITKGMEPITFEVDVTGVDVLTIKIIDSTTFTASHFALVDCKFTK